MKTTDLEDYEKLITKDYIKGELQQLRSDLLQQLMANQRWTTGLIIGAYGLLIALHFLK